MENAKQELLTALKDTANVKCASIVHNRVGSITLKVNYSQEDFNKFLKKLDFKYDSGYGSQELEGTVWLEDGTWLSRGEYDGSEWWEHNVLPEIPSECL